MAAQSVESKLKKVYNKYKDEETGNIEPEGTMEYLSDLDIDPEDVKALLLAQLLHSKSMGVFEMQPFIEGWAQIQAYDLDSMKKQLSRLSQELQHDDVYLKEVYEFTFGYIKEPFQKRIAFEDAVMYWNLLLQKKYPREVALWVDFVENGWKDTVSKDSWNMFLPFLTQFHDDPKLESHDENAAWPSMIDSFVEYSKENNKL